MSQHGAMTDGGHDLPYHAEVDEDENTVGAVVAGIARVEGVDVFELDITLYDFIDPEALNRVIQDAPRSSGVKVSFEVDSYHVTITGTGVLTIDRV